MNIPKLVKDHIENEHLSVSLHPSGCTSDSCIRQEMYRIHNYAVTEPRKPGESWKLASYGVYEQYIVDAMKKQYGPYFQQQAEFSEGLWHGRVDAVVHKSLIEIKSVNPWALEKPNLPYRHHVDQLHVYCELLKPEKAFLVYIERWQERRLYPEEIVQALHPAHARTGIVSWPDLGVPAIIQFDVTPTREDLAHIRGMMDEMERWAETEELPPRPYATREAHPWNCTAYNKRTRQREVRCPYLSLCWGEVGPYQVNDDEIPF